LSALTKQELKISMGEEVGPDENLFPCLQDLEVHCCFGLRFEPSIPRRASRAGSTISKAWDELDNEPRIPIRS
jgi:hypothetical protein